MPRPLKKSTVPPPCRAEVHLFFLIFGLYAENSIKAKHLNQRFDYIMKYVALRSKNGPGSPKARKPPKSKSAAKKPKVPRDKAPKAKTRVSKPEVWPI